MVLCVNICYDYGPRGFFNNINWSVNLSAETIYSQNMQMSSFIQPLCGLVFFGFTVDHLFFRGKAAIGPAGEP